MASTTDMAPTRSTASASRKSSPSSAARASAARQPREGHLEDQIEKLQADLKAIASTLASLAEEKVSDAQHMAKDAQHMAQKEVKNLARSGQHAVEDIQDEFGQLEKQIKDTIREKPLTAVAGAIALGFILAVVSR